MPLEAVAPAAQRWGKACDLNRSSTIVERHLQETFAFRMLTSASVTLAPVSP
ncbi:hypothetical protein CYD53_102404 [Bosea psychrotolerans]|uniref:Uncharacterized protein n=1 Tax=Bosea psychrotolerans TaxID=1871628 RepID=A0A2S4ML51_9HYPH|nr:hypothetical protein CYD53_102404 [Bosea psychrotolerans]